jgi:hypothetical protein
LDEIPEQELNWLGVYKIDLLSDKEAKDEKWRDHVRAQAALDNPYVYKIPISSLKEKTLIHLAVAGGKYPSVTQARKQGAEDGPVEVGSVVIWKKRGIIAVEG